MNQLLRTACQKYDYVVVDLPSLVPAPDVRAAAADLDAFLLVVRWGKTQQPVIKEALSASGEARSKLFGTVLNDARLTDIRRYCPWFQ